MYRRKKYDYDVIVLITAIIAIKYHKDIVLKIIATINILYKNIYKDKKFIKGVFTEIDKLA
jgi:hypothetical protein